jgi:mono/diheme cytochrome c family protein
MPRLSEGKKVYAQRCQSCHGAEGKPAAGVQAPSFAEKEWRRDLTTLDLMASLTDHAPIPEYSFRDRSLQERWDVLYYVWSLGTTADRVAKAQTLIFGKNCTVCHGDTAHGNGDLARVMAKGTIMEPPPRNLTDWVWMSTRTDRELFRNIKEGVRWSAMPPWKDVLTDQQIWEVLDYIRSLHYEE